MKQNDKRKTVLSRVGVLVLIAALALNLIGCGNAKTRESTDTARYEATTEIGTGKTKFQFRAVDLDGKATDFTILTDEKTVGAALLANNLIAGDRDDYGLYVKTVNGITADYEKDGCYWAFYVDGEYATSGVEQTLIDPAKIYQFKVEKS